MATKSSRNAEIFSKSRSKISLSFSKIFRSYEELNRTLGCTMVKTSLTTHSNRHRISSGSSRVQMRGSNQFKNKREKSSSSNLNESATEPSAETSVPLEEPQQPQSRSQEVVKTETEVKPEVVVESPGKKEKSPKPIKKPGKRGGIGAGSDRGTVS